MPPVATRRRPAAWPRASPCGQGPSAERLGIGRFCRIAHGVRFLTASASRVLSCFPLPAVDGATRAGNRPDTRDTGIGRDGRLGHGATAALCGRVPDPAVAAGNPTRVRRMSFTCTGSPRACRRPRGTGRPRRAAGGPHRRARGAGALTAAPFPFPPQRGRLRAPRQGVIGKGRRAWSG